MIENIIGKRYADALSGSIGDNAQLPEALKGLRGFCDAFRAEPRLERFFTNPAIPDAGKTGMVRELGERLKLHKDVLSLLLMLVERKKIEYADHIAEHFEKLADKRLGQARASVVAAHPLSDKNIERLKSALKNITGKDVLIETSVDETLIGGVVLRLGDLVADATVKNRLATLKRFIEKEEVA
jgi:F-type H+-transporting ATPase subunit delta